jgi:hypothetical protein
MIPIFLEAVSSEEEEALLLQPVKPAVREMAAKRASCFFMVLSPFQLFLNENILHRRMKESHFFSTYIEKSICNLQYILKKDKVMH